MLDLDEVQLIDVRTAEEYSQGHLINSHNIDYNSSSFEKDIAKLDRQKPIVVYCQKGGRSAKCAKKFLKAGFVDIYDLEGGYSQWLHEEIELE